MKSRLGDLSSKGDFALNFVVIQLSDIHVDISKDNHVLVKAEPMAAALFPHLIHADHVVVVVSGDVAYSGTSDQYRAAETFLRDFADRIEREWGQTVEFFVVPGNHDCDFSEESGSRRANIAYIQSGQAKVDASVIATCTEVQRAFFEFQTRMHGTVETDPLWFERKFPASERTVVLEGMNVSWVSKTRDVPGALHFPYERYQAGVRTPGDVHLMVLHHPANWFSQNTYAGFRRFLRERASIAFSGHEHMGGGSEITIWMQASASLLRGRFYNTMAQSRWHRF